MCKKFIIVLSFTLLFSLAGCSGTNNSNVNTGNSTTLSPKENVTTISKQESDNNLPQYFLKLTGDRPFGIAFDNKSIMYMITAPSSGSGKLLTVDAAAKITEIATLDGSFIGPGIDIDRDGNAYVTVGDKLLKITQKGKSEIIAEGFSCSFDVKLDLKGNIYVSDASEDTIYKINALKEKKVFYKGSEIGSFTFTGLSFDKSYDTLYAVENGKILKFHIKTDGSAEKPEVAVNDVPDSRYIDIDNDNNIYVSTGSNVMKITSDGQKINITDKVANSIGFSLAGRGFGDNCLFVAVADGIAKLPLSK